MQEQPFSHREIKSMFQDISSKLDDHSIVHDQILTQVKETNGRVTTLELWKARFEGAGWIAKISWMIIGVFIITASFALFEMYIQFQTLDVKIKEAVFSEISNYEFKMSE